jgi:hypothetical protein
MRGTQGEEQRTAAPERSGYGPARNYKVRGSAAVAEWIEAGIEFQWPPLRYGAAMNFHGGNSYDASVASGGVTGCEDCAAIECI